MSTAQTLTVVDSTGKTVALFQDLIGFALLARGNVTPTPALLPEGCCTFRYFSGAGLVFYVNDSGTIKTLTLGEPLT